MKFHYRSETETKTKSARHFCDTNDKVVYYYVHMQMMQHKVIQNYKNSKHESDFVK